MNNRKAVFMRYSLVCISRVFKIFCSCSLSLPLFRTVSRAKKKFCPLRNWVFVLAEAYALMVFSSPLQPWNLLRRVGETEIFICL